MGLEPSRPTGCVLHTPDTIQRHRGRPTGRADLILDSGQDLAIGYESDDDDGVELYLQESFSLHVANPDAG